MKHVLFWLFIAFVFAVPAFFVTVWTMPQIIMFVVTGRLAEIGGVNKIYHAPPPTHESFAVVTPSPDLAYSVCVFDLSDGPIQVTADYPEGVYWSISAYADNTDNFFVTNDQSNSGPPAHFVFDTSEQVDGTIVSPSTSGVILLRHQLTNPEAIELIDERRKNSSCTPLVQSPVPSG